MALALMAEYPAACLISVHSSSSEKSDVVQRGRGGVFARWRASALGDEESCQQP